MTLNKLSLALKRQKEESLKQIIQKMDEEAAYFAEIKSEASEAILKLSKWMKNVFYRIDDSDGEVPEFYFSKKIEEIFRFTEITEAARVVFLGARNYCSKLKEDNTTLHRDLSECSTSIEEKNNSLTKFAAELDFKKREIADLEGENKKLYKEIGNSREISKEMSRQIDNLKSNFKSKLMTVCKEIHCKLASLGFGIESTKEENPVCS